MSVASRSEVPVAELAQLFRAVQGYLAPIPLREVLEAACGWRVARVALSERTVLLVVPFLRRHGLAAAVSYERYVHELDVGKGGWSNRVARILPDDALEGDLYVYVADTAKTVLEAAAAEADGDPECFGDVLGIPYCCRKAYTSRLEVVRREQNDPIWSTLLGTTALPPYSLWNNVAAQYFGYALLSFAPCSMACPAASERAQAAWRLIGSVAPALAERFRAEHASEIVYSEREGVHRLVGAKWVGDRLYYEGACSTAETVLSRQLRMGDALEPVSARSFQLWQGDRLIRVVGESEGMGLFLCGERP